jgi:hypothetical protein
MLSIAIFKNGDALKHGVIIDIKGLSNIKLI